MARTTAVLVATIIEVEADKDISAFILTANELVTECCASVTSYSDDRLELIERYLSAHFYTHYDPMETVEKAATLTAWYQNAVDLGFDSSHYGQTAMRLDTSGGLAAINEQMKKGKRAGVGISWLGKTKDEVIADNDQ